MNRQQLQTQGWRFFFPAGKHPDEPRGLGLNRRGGVATVAGAEAIRQSILMLLATRPGERVGRPSYGCDVHRLVFEPNDRTTAGLAIHYVRTAINRWEPRVLLTRVDANAPAEAPSQIVIEVSYVIRHLNVADMLSYALDLS